MLFTIAVCWALARDLEFERIEVEWIAETRTVRNLNQVLPSETANLIRLLGNADYAARMLAEPLPAGRLPASVRTGQPIQSASNVVVPPP